MRISYLFFAYRNPKLIQKEIRALSSPESNFFIHIDGKVDIKKFSGIGGNDVVFLKDRLHVHWAEFSGVRAILNLMREALEKTPRTDYLILLSGSEYPIRSQGYIHRFFEENRGTEFIDLTKIPNPTAGKPLSHITTLRPPSTQPMARFWARALTRTGLLKRNYQKHLGAIQPFGGHTWWALSREASRYVLDFTAANPAIVRFFEYAPQPEETFIQTILGNSEFLHRVRKNLLYEDWSAGGAHPAMITHEHVKFFEQTDKVEVTDPFGMGEVLFARKLSDDSLHLTDELDRMIASKEKF